MPWWQGTRLTYEYLSPQLKYFKIALPSPLLYFTLLYFTLLYFTLLYFTLLYFTLNLLYFTLLYFWLQTSKKDAESSSSSSIYSGGIMKLSPHYKKALIKKGILQNYLLTKLCFRHVLSVEVQSFKLNRPITFKILHWVPENQFHVTACYRVNFCLHFTEWNNINLCSSCLISQIKSSVLLSHSFTSMVKRKMWMEEKCPFWYEEFMMDDNASNLDHNFGKCNTSDSYS
jgi:hypothetical protein